MSLPGTNATTQHVRFAHRPVGVNTHHCSVNVARGLALLFGIATRPFHYGIRGGGTISYAVLPSGWQVKRTYLGQYPHHQPEARHAKSSAIHDYQALLHL